MDSTKQGWNEPMADILADTKRYLDDAEKTLVAVNAGARLAPNISREEAVQILEKNIASYTAILARYPGRR